MFNCQDFQAIADGLLRVADRLAQEQEKIRFFFWFYPPELAPPDNQDEVAPVSEERLFLTLRWFALGGQVELPAWCFRFQVELPAWYFGLLEEDEESQLMAIGHLRWLGPPGLWQDYFAWAAKTITLGKVDSPDFWLTLLVQAAFGCPHDPLLSFSTGPLIVVDGVPRERLQLWTVLDYPAGLSADLEQTIQDLPVPWVLYAELSRPFVASAALCRLYAEQARQQARG